MSDGYIRLRRTGPQLFGSLEGRDSLLFVDVDEGADVASLRDVPHAYVISARTFLFRTRAQSDDIRDLLRRFDFSQSAQSDPSSRLRAYAPTIVEAAMTRAVDIDCPNVLRSETVMLFGKAVTRRIGCGAPAGTYCNEAGVGADLCQERINAARAKTRKSRVRPTK